jgi:hypothetical protein
MSFTGFESKSFGQCLRTLSRSSCSLLCSILIKSTGVQIAMHFHQLTIQSISLRRKPRRRARRSCSDPESRILVDLLREPLASIVGRRDMNLQTSFNEVSRHGANHDARLSARGSDRGNQVKQFHRAFRTDAELSNGSLPQPPSIRISLGLLLLTSPGSPAPAQF